MDRGEGSTGGVGTWKEIRRDLKEIGGEKMLVCKRSLHGPGSRLPSGHTEPCSKWIAV